MDNQILNQDNITTNPPTWQHPVLPGNCPGEGYLLETKNAFVESPQSADNFQWVKNTQITDADKAQIQTNKEDIEDLKDDIADLEVEKSSVSGENDGTNWTSITINGTKKNIPVDGGTGAVSSVNGKTGTVELNAGDIPVGGGQAGNILSKLNTLTDRCDTLDTNVNTALDNTADLAVKKVDKEDGKSLISNDDITQITTNKNNINAHQTSIDALDEAVGNLTNEKQDKLISGTNIKTVNGNSLLGSGNIEIGGGGGFSPTTEQLNAMNSGIDSAKVAQIATNTTNISNKVDKDGSKVLSTNDYTNADKAKVDVLNGDSETLVFTLADSSTVTLKLAKAV